ncbi:hypothetical protein BGZ95_001630 [Linnemannia exigua]|uniref:Receptor ligand binding region domain-containing protein n=1 Tax=Linnemannia exigua TaxID=604196 RepID=A0AAD4D764_9FUNG|nr:hypothetical protein BGZ95_001630 [Linnemannia exigua]
MFQQNENTKDQLQERPVPIYNHPRFSALLSPGAAITTPRPAKKPSLLTDFEYETMWDPQPDTLRLGVLLPLNAIDHYLEASTIRKTLSAIRMAVDDINRLGIIPGGNVTLVLRDSQNPDLFTPSGGAAAISGAGSLISAKVSGVIGDIRSDLTQYEALMTSSVKISQCSFASINTILSDYTMYPWFFRTIPTTIVILDAALKTILELGWRRITLIYDVDIIGLAEQPEDPTFQFIKDTIDETQSRIQLLISVGRMQTRILREMSYPGAGDPVLNRNEALAYSCAMMIANVYADLIKQTIGEHATLNDPYLREVLDGDHTDDVHVATFYREKPYVGPSGKILLDEMGDRQNGAYQAFSLQDGTSVPFALIFGSNYTKLKPAPFKSNHKRLPLDTPPGATRTFIIPIGITLLAGSLTFKNYMIYRIFNSITVTNRIFHTGRLLKFLVVAVILTAISPIVEVLFYPPIPNTINASHEQWIRCRDPNGRHWRFLAAAVVPIFLVVFGVFLAFKTRNVMFLWNEAREISLVI